MSKCDLNGKRDFEKRKFENIKKIDLMFKQEKLEKTRTLKHYI